MSKIVDDVDGPVVVGDEYDVNKTNVAVGIALVAFSAWSYYMVRRGIDKRIKRQVKLALKKEKS